MMGLDVGLGVLADAQEKRLPNGQALVGFRVFRVGSGTEGILRTCPGVYPWGRDPARDMHASTAASPGAPGWHPPNMRRKKPPGGETLVCFSL